MPSLPFPNEGVNTPPESSHSAEKGPIEPRCYGHVFDPHHEAGSHHPAMDGWPAHEWSSPFGGWCQHCPHPLTQGDRYVCVEGGVIHVECVADLDAEVAEGGESCG